MSRNSNWPLVPPGRLFRVETREARKSCMAAAKRRPHKDVPPIRPSRCYGRPRATVAPTVVPMIRALSRFFLAALALFVAASALALLVVAPAQAHPHVWVTMKSEVVYGADGAATGIRHA